MKYKLHDTIVKSTTIVVVSTVLLVTAAFSAYLFYIQYTYLGDGYLNLAKTLADTPIITEFLKTGENRAAAVDYVEKISDDASYYIVVLDEHQNRLIHPTEALIGTKAQTNLIAPTNKSEDHYAFDSEGSLGAGFKALAAVMEGDELIGNVVIIQLRNSFYITFATCVVIVALFSVAAILASTRLSNIMSKKIRTLLLNYEPEDIVRITKEREIALNTINEGLLLYTGEHELSFANMSAIEMLKLDFDDTESHKKIFDLFKDAKSERTPYFAAKYKKHSYYVARNDIVEGDVIIGSVFTIRPKEAVFVFAEELTGVKNYMEAVRAQVHEFRNTMHTVSGLVELERFDVLKNYIQSVVIESNSETMELDDMINDHILSAFLHSKYSRAREMSVTFTTHCDNIIPEITNSEKLNDVITVIGNLLENAFESFKGNKKLGTVLLTLDYDDEASDIYITVENNSEIASDIDVFAKGVSTKGEGRGHGLWKVQNCVEANSGDIELIREPSKTIFIARLNLKEVNNDEN